MNVYSKIPVIRAFTTSQGVLGGLINGGAYIPGGGGGGGLISGIKKTFRNEPRQCRSKYFFRLKSHIKAACSLVQFCHPA